MGIDGWTTLSNREYMLMMSHVVEKPRAREAYVIPGDPIDVSGEQP